MRGGKYASGSRWKQTKAIVSVARNKSRQPPRRGRIESIWHRLETLG
jgi:hypothetical protein